MKLKINGMEIEGDVHEIVEVITIMDRRNMSSATTVEVSEPVQKVVKTDTVKKKRAIRIKQQKQLPWKKVLKTDVSKYTYQELSAGKTPREIKADLKHKIKIFGYGIKSKFLNGRISSAIHLGKKMMKSNKVTPNEWY
ncbi:MAG: hypothetical protein KKD44_27260 [Proteobacteria bacterium]|nr:hypothetical protein [Pseudomonadota bacterium]